MHPQLFLKTFWRLELQPQVFVAMSFSEEYQQRFNNVIEPAINSIPGVNLKPYRVDLSKTGDSILTDIMDGIAHCQLFLADVSTVGKDSVSGKPYRNGNVMYEVGLALACRHSSEVLLVRDDRDRFLFDVSTIPHKFINFADEDAAISDLRSALVNRLEEQNYINDARVKLAVARLSSEETVELEFGAGRETWGREHRPYAGQHELAISRLLDKQLVKIVGKYEDGTPAYSLTPLGHVAARSFTSDLLVLLDK